MNTNNRLYLVMGILLFVLGAVFLAFNFIPGLTFRSTWPLIFLIIAVAFYAPVLIWPGARRGLSALFIPGSIFLVLGLIFLYNTLSHDWVSWAYAWILIPGSVGLGMALASWIGQWHNDVTSVGIWMGLVSLALFAFFAAIFGGLIIKTIGAGVLIVSGILLLVRSLRKKPAQE